MKGFLEQIMERAEKDGKRFKTKPKSEYDGIAVSFSVSSEIYEKIDFCIREAYREKNCFLIDVTFYSPKRTYSFGITKNIATNFTTNQKKEIDPWTEWLEKEILFWLEKDQKKRLDVLFYKPKYDIRGVLA